jgi:AraC family transcriptional regulator
MMHQFNKTIDYLESTLTSEVELKKFQNISGYSYPLFSRIFSILSEITLAEYLRNRKLTLAVDDLLNTDQKVIDIALKYNYDSADAFSFAFKKFHGNSPSEVPSTWDELYSKYSFEQLESFGNGQSLGVCYENEGNDKINYMAGYNVLDDAKARNLGLDILEVKETEYAVVPVKGSVPDSIHQAWKYLLEEFFPENGYKHSGLPDFEVYTENDIHDPNYEMELWVPISKQ